MRWVFISLLLINAIVFVWHSVESGRQERIAALSASHESDAGVVSGAPLLLLSELSEQERLELTKPKPVVPAPAPPVVAAPVVVGQEAPLAPVTAAAVNNTAEAISQESKSTELKSTELKPTERKPLAPNQCLILGPVSLPQIEQVSQRLMVMTIISEPFDLEVKGAPEYWVVLPPFPDDKQALQKLQQLQGRGFQAQIIPGGPLANAISFGLRGRKADADALAADLQSKGNKVEVKAVPVSRKEKWLALSERQAPKLNDEIWLSIKSDFPKLEKRIKSCY